METLAARIARQGALRETDAIGWVIRFAKSLEAIHARGSAHGHVSPECVLIQTEACTSKGWLLDLRRASSPVVYHSPEMARGELVSKGDDVWALAVMLYQMLTGALPYVSNSDRDLLDKFATITPTPLAVFQVGDDLLQAIIDRALHPDRRLRNVDVGELRRALEKWRPEAVLDQLPALEGTMEAMTAAVPLYEEHDEGDDEFDDDEVTKIRADVVPLLQNLVSRPSTPGQLVTTPAVPKVPQETSPLEFNRTLVAPPKDESPLDFNKKLVVPPADEETVDFNKTLLVPPQGDVPDFEKTLIAPPQSPLKPEFETTVLEPKLKVIPAPNLNMAPPMEQSAPPTDPPTADVEPPKPPLHPTSSFPPPKTSQGRRRTLIGLANLGLGQPPSSGASQSSRPGPRNDSLSTQAPSSNREREPSAPSKRLRLPHDDDEAVTREITSIDVELPTETVEKPREPSKSGKTPLSELERRAATQSFDNDELPIITKGSSTSEPDLPPLIDEEESSERQEPVAVPAKAIGTRALGTRIDTAQRAAPAALPSVRNRASAPKQGGLGKGYIVLFVGSILIAAGLISWRWIKPFVKDLTGLPTTPATTDVIPSAAPTASTSVDPAPPNTAPSTSSSAAEVSSADVSPSSALSGPEQLNACMVTLFPKGTFASGVTPNFAFVCTEADPRKAGDAIRSRVVIGANREGVSDGMKEWALLGWYELAAFAVMRAQCCSSPEPLALPKMTNNVCAPMPKVLEELGAASVTVSKVDDKEMQEAIKRFSNTVHCLVRAGAAFQFGRIGKPRPGEDTAFERMLTRILEVRHKK